MGAETSTTHLIFFMVAMIIAGSMAAVMYMNFAAVTDAASKGGSTLSGQLKTDITIINDPSRIPTDGTNYTFYVKNTGRSNLAHELVTVIINGIVVPDSDVNKTILGGSTVWRPFEVLQLNVTQSSMPSGDNTIRVITENGIYDSMDFVK